MGFIPESAVKNNRKLTKKSAELLYKLDQFGNIKRLF